MYKIQRQKIISHFLNCLPVVLVVNRHAALLHSLVVMDEAVRPVAELFPEIVRVEARLANARRAPGRVLSFREIVITRLHH